MANLFQELKRRKVFRVAAAYLVVAWILIQVAETITPSLQLPQWTPSLVTVLLILGFLPTIIAAWAYEITPEGIKPNASVPLSNGTQATSAQAINYIILVVVLLVAGFQIVDRFLNSEVGIVLREYPGGSDNDVMRTHLNLGLGKPDFYTRFPVDVSISPDGKKIVFVHGSDNVLLSSRNIAELNTNLLFELNNESGHFTSKPTISPDGENVLFYKSPEGLSVIPIEGGEIRTLTRDGDREVDTSGGWGWLDQETPMFVGLDSSIYAIPLSSNDSVKLADLNGKEIRWPIALPDKRALLYTVYGERSSTLSQYVELYDIESAQPRLLIEDAYHPQYLNSGHIAFVRNNAIWIVPFSLDSMEISGPAKMVVPNVAASGSRSRAVYAVADSGTLIYLPPVVQNVLGVDRELVWVDRQGNVELVPIEPGLISNPRISPNGNQISFLREQGQSSDLWIWDTVTQVESRLTSLGDVGVAIWSKDGDHLIFQRYRPNVRGIWQVRSDGSGQPDQIEALTTRWNPPMFTTANDEQLVYINGLGTSHNLISSVTLNDQRIYNELFPIADSYEAALSPDQNWIAVASREGGIGVDIAVSPFSQGLSGGRRLVAQNAREPLWSPNTEEIFYITTPERTLMSSRIVGTSPFVTSPGVAIAKNLWYSIARPTNYDVTPDGSRFIFLREAQGEVSAFGEVRLELIVVTNWFRELEQLVQNIQ